MIQRLQAKRNEEGFTLIELLIVIIVLGILAAIVVFAVGSTRKDSVASSCKTSSKSIELSGEAVNTKMGAYPGTTNSKTDIDAVASGLQNPLIANSITPDNGALLKTWPSDSDYILQWKGSAVQVFPKTYNVTGAGVVEKAAGVPAVDADALSCTTLP